MKGAGKERAAFAWGKEHARPWLDVHFDKLSFVHAPKEPFKSRWEGDPAVDGLWRWQVSWNSDGEKIWTPSNNWFFFTSESPDELVTRFKTARKALAERGWPAASAGKADAPDYSSLDSRC